MTTSTGEGTSMAAKLEEVLQAVRDVESKVDDKLSAMKREMESADDRLVKRMRLDTKPTFRKRGHEKQHQFNEQVRDKMDAATAALEQTPPAVEKARTLLKEGEKLINARQKCILIADRSEHGWATVAEYEEDELADNSDDEKRLFRAEVRAGRKTKQKSVKETKKKGGPAKKPYRSSWSNPAPWSGEHAQPGGSATVGMQWLVPQYVSQGSRLSSMPTVTNNQLGPCFLCGKLGHFRKNCPLLHSGSPAKST